MAVWAKLVINNHDYTKYVKQKTGLSWQRDNTNNENAGRDMAETMHPNVTSHQRILDITLGPMPFSVAQQLETDLQGNDEGVEVQYPDLKDGQCTRLFYNTSITSALECFRDNDVLVDNIKFSLTTVKEATINAG